MNLSGTLKYYQAASSEDAPGGEALTNRFCSENAQIPLLQSRTVQHDAAGTVRGVDLKLSLLLHQLQESLEDFRGLGCRGFGFWGLGFRGLGF